MPAVTARSFPAPFSPRHCDREAKHPIFTDGVLGSEGVANLDAKLREMQKAVPVSPNKKGNVAPPAQGSLKQ